jgi:hypothetical protein
MPSVKDEWNDAVMRLERFREANPDVKITPPGNGNLMWKVRAGDILLERFSLGRLMDVLEARDG